MHSQPVYQRILPLLKLGLGVAIVAYLIYQAQGHERFHELLEKPKDWPLLAGAFGLVVVAIVLSFVRWWMLVQAIGLPFSLADALRLGSLGFALNFVAPGGVGGDLFKAVAVAREHKSRSSEAVATVVADRVLGFFALLSIASIATLASGLLFDDSMSRPIRWLSIVPIAASVAIVVFGALLMVPGKISRSTAELLSRIPVAGSMASSLLRACQVMSRRLDIFFPAMLVSFVVHLLLVFSFYLVARGLPFEAPDLLRHFFIVPLAETAGTIPITPGGLGTTEAVLEQLYQGVGTPEGSGVIVALGQRLIMLSVGVIAMIYYLTQRRLISSTLDDVEAATSH